MMGDGNSNLFLRFPSDLVDQCLQQTDDANPGELLELVLSVLLEGDTTDYASPPLDELQLSWTNSLPKDISTKTSITTLPDVMYSVISQSDTNNLQKSIRKQLADPLPESGTALLETKWFFGMQLIALLLQHDQMTAFEVHSVAMQSMLQLGSSPEMTKRRHYYLSWTLLVLLATWSLQKCHNQIIQSTPNGPRIRFKRIQSILLETINLYQRLALRVDIYPDDEEERDIYLPTPTELAVPLWTRQIVPIAMTLWDQLPSNYNSSSVFWPALLVSVASHLAVIYGNGETVVAMLQSSLQQATPNWDLGMLCHPWRVASHQHQRFPIRRTPPRREESLDWWTCERQYIQDEDSDMEDEDDDPTTPDPYEGIDATWNHLGVALLAYHAWPRNSACCVYQPRFQWKVWFPHVATLMNQNPDQQIRYSDLLTANNKLEITIQGISLLHALLPILPQQSLIVSHSFSLMEGASNETASGPPNTSRPRPPDHPVGTFQLLLNTLVAATTTTNSQEQPQLPRPMVLFQLCKDLLSKYTPTSQLTIVWDHLLPTCPHPGLKPKLLDMLRPLMAASDNTICTRLRQELETILTRDLGQFVVVSNGKLEFQNVPELIDQCEFFVAVCGLVQLGWRNHPTDDAKHPRNIPLQPSTKLSSNLPTLSDFGQALREHLETWNKQPTNDVPDEFFRLDLLVMAIQLILDVPLSA